MTNTSKSRTIKAIKLQYYPTDVWGDDLWPKYRQTTFTMTIEPGQTEYTDWFYMSPSWYTIDTIYWGIAMIVFDDGTICENDDIAYWTISLH